MFELSASKLKLFKACRRAYQLKYVEGLVPTEKSAALETGLTYHKRLEQLYKEGVDDGSYSKEAAMAEAYRRHILPTIPSLQVVEGWMEEEIDGFLLRGRVDGLTGDSIVEHKTTSLVPDEYVYFLQWEEQPLVYMHLTGIRKVMYTICRKPTIRQKKGETEEEFYNRCIEWYDEDTPKKIGVFAMTCTPSDVDACIDSIVHVAREMRSPDCVYYRNSCHCHAWGRECEYAPVCKYYDPNQEYIGFERKKESGCNERLFS